MLCAHCKKEMTEKEKDDYFFFCKSCYSWFDRRTSGFHWDPPIDTEEGEQTRKDFNRQLLEQEEGEQNE